MLSLFEVEAEREGETVPEVGLCFGFEFVTFMVFARICLHFSCDRLVRPEAQFVADIHYEWFEFYGYTGSKVRTSIHK